MEKQEKKRERERERGGGGGRSRGRERKRIDILELKLIICKSGEGEIKHCWNQKYRGKCTCTLTQVRNSSTLLFSALVTRIFGAKRVQDEHSMENKMTAKEFFTRFPTLHRFLLNQLEEGVRLMRMGNEQ